MPNVAVIGAGTMGNGIAQVFAQTGSEVTLIDTNQAALQRAIEKIDSSLSRLVKKEKMSEQEKQQALKHLTTTTDLNEGTKDSDLVVEAATENMKIKLDIFRQLDENCKPSAILATNTSSISITQIASATNRPDKVIGMHFMNPVPIMKLVEIISGYSTSEETKNYVVEMSTALGKIPVVANDYPGFVANRILMPMINEAIWSLHEGVAGVMEIDQIMKLGMAHPMGPLRLADFIGLDVCKAILDVLYQGFGNPKYAPCPLLVNMVNAKKLGAKSGEGFYVWEKGSKEEIVSPQFTK